MEHCKLLYAVLICQRSTRLCRRNRRARVRMMTIYHQRAPAHVALAYLQQLDWVLIKTGSRVARRRNIHIIHSASWRFFTAADCRRSDLIVVRSSMLPTLMFEMPQCIACALTLSAFWGLLIFFVLVRFMICRGVRCWLVHLMRLFWVCMQILCMFCKNFVELINYDTRTTSHKKRKKEMIKKKIFQRSKVFAFEHVPFTMLWTG